MHQQPNHARSIVYQILVKSFLKEDWSDYFDGLTISHPLCPQGTAITSITGRVRDQSELYALLQRVHDLNLELLAVKQLPAVAVDDET